MAEIQFARGVAEPVVPDVRLTRSKMVPMVRLPFILTIPRRCLKKG
jgi:hypothetical protein